MKNAGRESKSIKEERKWTTPKINRTKNGIVKCLLCGCYWEGWHKCPAIDATCAVCGFIGHFARICRSYNKNATGNIKASTKKKRSENNRFDKYKQEKTFSANSSSSTQYLSAQTRHNLYHDFYNEHFYYQHVRCSSDQIPILVNNTVENARKRHDNLAGNSSGFNKEKRMNKRSDNTEKDNNKRNETNNYSNHEGNDDNNNNEKFPRKKINETKSSKFKTNRMSADEAAKLKEEANHLYKKEEYNLALAEYSKLIKNFPNNEIYYGNRSACNLMMGNYEEALRDARRSITINSKFIKGYYRVIKCTMITGRLDELKIHLSNLEKLDASDKILMSVRGQLEELELLLKSEKDAQNTKDHVAALKCINKCIAMCPFSVAYKLRKAQYLTYLERYDEADCIAKDILDVDEKNSQARYILSIRIYKSNLDDAIVYLEQIVRDAPNFTKALGLYKKAKKIAELKRKGNEAFRDGKYCEAHGFYTRAMMIDPWNKKIKMELYNNMAQASYKLGYRLTSIKESSRALEIDNAHLKCLMRRGICYLELENYEKALPDFQRGCEIDPGNEKFKKLFDETKMKLEEKEREERERKQKEEEERQRREEERKQRKEREKQRREERRKQEYWRRFDDDFFNRFRDEFFQGKRKQGYWQGYNGKQYSRNEDKQENGRGEEEQSRRRQPRSRDYYGILGLNKNAPITEIKAAYRKLSLMHHPDRHANASEEVKKENEEKMKLITQAYRELTEAEATGFEFQR